MLKKIKKYLETFFSHMAFSFFISLLIFISIVFIILQRLIEFSPHIYYLIEKIDFIIVIIFTVEFVLKFILWRFKYFFSDYGWIDFLCILPIFSPALKSMRMIRSIRSIRILRLLRLLRVLRILKISHYYKYSPLKQKVFLPTSTLIMIIILLTGFIFINNQEDLLIKYQKEKLINIIEATDITKNEKLIEISRGNDITFQRFNEDVYKMILLEYIIRIDHKGYRYTFILKDTFQRLRIFELRIIILSFISLIILIITLNTILDKTILNPIIAVNNKINKIVTVKDVPLSGDRRMTINFDQSIDYSSKDEIGSIVKNFNNLLVLLKKQQQISKGALSNLCSTIMNIFEHYHANTRGHSFRTAILSTAIAYRMGFKEEELRNIFYGAILHDIGKISVDKNVLMKPGKFNEEEKKEMQRHPGLGYKIGLDFPLLSEIELLIIRDHHEQLSGNGYPLGLKGDEIAPAARIATAADIFDAITCPRDYKNAKPVEKVLQIMDDMIGKWLDKKIMQILKSLLSEKIIIVDCTLPDENNWITIDEDKLGARVNFLNKETDLDINTKVDM